MHICHMDSLSDAQKKLETMHTVSRFSKIIKLVLELFINHMKGDEKIVNYLAKVKNIKDQLDVCNCEFFQDKILYFIIKIKIHEKFRNYLFSKLKISE